jgi:son of sevenless-like protein
MRKLIDVLEKEDLHIVDRVKNFANGVLANDPDMAAVGKNLLQIIQRLVSLSQVHSEVIQ